MTNSEWKDIIKIGDSGIRLEKPILSPLFFFMTKRTLYTEIQAIEALTIVLTAKLRTEVVRGEIMELVLANQKAATRIKENFRDYPEVVDVFDEGEDPTADTQTETQTDETASLKWNLDYLQTLIHLINYGVNGRPAPAEKLPQYAGRAKSEINRILEKWEEFPDVVKDFPYPEEAEEDEAFNAGDEYYD
ncbi:MAG: hypothetical protein ACRCT1_06085 [Microcoleaceae cyanobacterium]